MAATGLLALLDDIATLLDDVAILTKVAAKKTAGVLGDDLALNAEQVSGVRAERELPVVWAVAKGSFLNKLILVPAALAISALVPWLITPLLIIGGLYLCYEGFEKVLHKVLHSPDEQSEEHLQLLKAVADEEVDLVAFEKNKIKGAIRTDFILSAEIIVIALGTVADRSFAMQSLVVSTIALLVTIGVYGLVAGIVKLDDAGLHFIKTGADGSLKERFGKFLLLFAPKLMKALAILGTIAMFLVGGGIIAHGLPFLHHIQADVKLFVEAHLSIMLALTDMLFSGVVGIVAGAITLAIVTICQKLFRPSKSSPASH